MNRRRYYAESENLRSVKWNEMKTFHSCSIFCFYGITDLSYTEQIILHRIFMMRYMKNLKQRTLSFRENEFTDVWRLKWNEMMTLHSCEIFSFYGISDFLHRTGCSIQNFHDACISAYMGQSANIWSFSFLQTFSHPLQYEILLLTYNNSL